MAANEFSKISDMSALLYLNGEWKKSSGPQHDVINPATEEREGSYADATSDEIETAVANANKAQKIWWSMSALDRANALHQVADAMQSMLEPVGVLVVIEAEHSCMSIRGVRKPGTKTVTTAVRGIYRTDSSARAEVMAFIQGR